MELKIVEEQEEKQSNRKIVFSHKRAFGDTLMFTAGVRDFKLLFPDIEINVESNHMFVFDNNPYINRSISKSQPGVEFYKVGYPAIATANNTYIHFTNMFLLDMIAAADLEKALPISLGEFCASFSNGEIGDPDLGNPKKNPEAREPYISIREKYRGFCEKFSRMRGDIHMTEEEKNLNIVRDIYNIQIPYWVVAPGGKSDCTSKIWDWRRFQKVIDYFDGLIKFVVIGKSNLIVEHLTGVLNLVDKFNTNPRGLFSLIYNADGCVSGPSFLMHAAAAVPPRFKKERKPCVTIIGGREPIGWTWYTNHQILHTNGVFSCCSNGGCWTARVYPMPDDKERNHNLCKKPTLSSGRTIQSCMDTITANDVIRAIEKYYEGDIYSLNKSLPAKVQEISINIRKDQRAINLLGNLHTEGGGEQSLCMIARVLKQAGYKVYLYPWTTIHNKIREMFPDLEENFQQDANFHNMSEKMITDIPLLFYANDRTREFVEEEEAVKIVNNSSDVLIGINFVHRPISNCNWLAKSGKVKAFIFQNKEKKEEFVRENIGFDEARKIVLFGAIDLDKFLEINPRKREKGQKLVVLKHCVADYRKYVTQGSVNKGDRIHVWQNHIIKELDIKFYERLLSDFKDSIQFEFMEAHKELVSHFNGHKDMIFHKWNAMPVTKFLARGHVYLYRTSNLWRDQYPRVVAEALASGLPVLSEPRDGTYDRIIHGDTGFYCIDYDAYRYALALLIRKERYRQDISLHAKEYARKNLNPQKWVEVIEDVVYRRN